VGSVWDFVIRIYFVIRHSSFVNHMNFLAPAAFAFAAAIPVVIVFYLLKRKRVVRLVRRTAREHS